MLDGDSTFPPKNGGGGHSTPNFGPCLLCQTVGWIKIKLGMEIGLGPGHIVLYEDPAPQRGTPPIFGPCLLWPNGHPSELLLSTWVICYKQIMFYIQFLFGRVSCPSVFHFNYNGL